EALGCEVVIEPLLIIEPDSGSPIDITGIQALIVTSRNALRALNANAHLQTLRSLPLFAVGDATGALAVDMGFQTVCPGTGEARDLPALIARTLPDRTGPVLHLAGDVLAFDLERPLREAGYSLRRQIIYRSRTARNFSPAVLALFQSGKIDSVLLMSPRTAHTYADLVNKMQLADISRNLVHFCLSERVCKALDTLPEPEMLSPRRPNMEEMLALIADTVAKKR
ncbi:MAG TPA: uroporphyrinogen-III synthase, partial [Rhizobiales bacterium]|nr:uroporphyrinogen-III synthase [Hyphomicrobiales bacterium]